jgi:hypothetical protein
LYIPEDQQHKKGMNMITDVTGSYQYQHTDEQVHFTGYIFEKTFLQYNEARRCRIQDDHRKLRIIRAYAIITGGSAYVTDR